jgi:hypothetical protein
MCRLQTWFILEEQQHSKVCYTRPCHRHPSQQVSCIRLEQQHSKHTRVNNAARYECFPNQSCQVQPCRSRVLCVSTVWDTDTDSHQCKARRHNRVCTGTFHQAHPLYTGHLKVTACKQCTCNPIDEPMCLHPALRVSCPIQHTTQQPSAQHTQYHCFPHALIVVRLPYDNSVSASASRQLRHCLHTAQQGTHAGCALARCLTPVQQACQLHADPRGPFSSGQLAEQDTKPNLGSCPWYQPIAVAAACCRLH